MTALYVGGMGARGRNFYNALTRRYGFEAEAALIQDLYLSGKKEEAAAAVPDELLELTSLVGPARVRAGADRRLPRGGGERAERHTHRPRPARHHRATEGVVPDDATAASSWPTDRRAWWTRTTTRAPEEGPVPEPGPGQALIGVRYLSMDPTIRTWMDDAPGYLPPIELGETVRGAGIGEVLVSNSDRYAVGDLVVGLTGWQDYVIADEGAASMQVIPAGRRPAPGAQRARRHGDDGVLRDDRRGQGDRGRHRGRVGRGRGHRVGRRSDRPDQRRDQGGRHRRHGGEVRVDRRRARVRRRDQLQDRRRRRVVAAAVPRGDRPLLRQRRAATSSTSVWPSWPCGAGSSCAAPSRSTTRRAGPRGRATSSTSSSSGDGWRASSSSTTSIGSSRRRSTWWGGWPKAR